MVDALKHRLKAVFAEGGWSSGITILLWCYWAVYSLVTPVAFYDSQTYNLARLEIFEAGGFWGNNLWNTERQISFPWTFDALHLPFLRIGTGAALPSFACFTGLLWIVYRLVREHYSSRAAWLCCLGLMAMPMMAYQATSTKNDIVIVFALACWFYALTEFKRTRRHLHLLAMAASLGLAAGSKSSGIPLALIAGLISLGVIGRDFRDLRIFAASALLGIVLLGSIEIYINNQLMFGRPLGSRELIDPHRNLDGVRGAAANIIRYAFGNATTGLERSSLGKEIATSTADACRSTLYVMGLSGVGYHPAFNDTGLVFSHSTLEGNADFGAVGTLAIISVAGVLVFYRRRDRVMVLLAITAVASLTIVSFTTAWMPWNNRFLLLPMAAAVITLMISAENHAPRFLRNSVLIIAILGAVHPLFASFNRKPEHIGAALKRRLHYSLKENSNLYEVVRDIQTRSAAGEFRHLVLHAGGDAWILPFFSISSLTVHPEPQLTGEVLRNPKYKTAYVLVLDRTITAEASGQLTLVRNYDAAKAALYLISK